jgi:GT2 family glycosyltransferase
VTETTQQPDVSILIVSWNVKELLRDCLRSLKENAGNVRYETIIVDNASKDGSPDMIRNEFPWAKLIEPHANLGFGRANNLAYEHSTGRWVLLLNPDTVVLDRAIEKLVAFADAQPKAGAVGGKTLKADLSLERSCCWGSPGLWPLMCKSVGLHLIFKQSELFNREAMDWWPRNTIREVEVITGCFFMLRREVYEKTGGFDPRFFMYAEEVDLCWRIKKLGWKLMFTPEAQIIHLVGASAAKAKPNRVFQINLGLLKLFRKHYGSAYMKVANLLMWMFYATRVPIMYGAIDLGLVNGETTAKAEAYRKAMASHVRLFRRQYEHEIDKA